MGKSYVLKDRTGQPRGYLMELAGRICCRAQTGAEQAVLIVLFEDGVQETHALTGETDEQRWPCAGRILCGGFVCADDRLLLSSGEAADLAFDRIRVHQPKEQKPIRPEQPREIKEVPMVQQDVPACDDKPACDETPLCERRWPPPPCWPAARYAHGRWQEEVI